MKEKQKVIAGYRSRYRKADRKGKAAVLNEIQFITGYNRKYAARILNKPQALLVVNGKAVKLKPSKPKPPNRAGKKIYTEEVIAPSPPANALHRSVARLRHYPRRQR
ncbi:MAG: hypothetical protein LBP80_05915 [Treponema sp.]|jgi:hypothetical protein|nr:hypothetical protein [Treponema sp.]